MEAEAARPKSVKVISWVWISTGILTVFSSLMSFFSLAMMQEMLGSEAFPLEQIPPDLQALLKPMMLVLDNFELIMVLQLVVAIFAIVSGVYFLKLRKWARTAMEALTWLAVAYTVVLGVYGVYLWVSTIGGIPVDQLPPGMENLKYIGVMIGVVVSLIFCVPFVIMLVKLRGAGIKSIVE